MKPVIAVAAAVLSFNAGASSPPATVDQFISECTAAECRYYLLGSLDQIALQVNKSSCYMALEEKADTVVLEIIARLGESRNAGHGAMPLWRAVRSAAGASVPECALP